MPKVQIYCDELYPYYGLMEREKEHDCNCEVTTEFLERYRQACVNFNNMQAELETLYKNAGRKI